MKIQAWDELFMRYAYLISQKSKDPSTKIGAVLVKGGDTDVLSCAYNGFPRGISDKEELYLNRECKHKLVCHSEFNAIVNAARKGVSTLDTILYTPATVCSECAKIIIQAGVREIIYHKQYPRFDHLPKWEESCKLAKALLEEAGVKTREFDMVLSIQTLLNGKIINC